MREDAIAVEFAAASFLRSDFCRSVVQMGALRSRDSIREIFWSCSIRVSRLCPVFADIFTFWARAEGRFFSSSF